MCMCVGFCSVCISARVLPMERQVCVSRLGWSVRATHGFGVCTHFEQISGGVLCVPPAECGVEFWPPVSLCHFHAVLSCYIALQLNIVDPVIFCKTGCHSNGYGRVVSRNVCAQLKGHKHRPGPLHCRVLARSYPVVVLSHSSTHCAYLEGHDCEAKLVLHQLRAVGVAIK